MGKGRLKWGHVVAALWAALAVPAAAQSSPVVNATGFPPLSDDSVVRFNRDQKEPELPDLPLDSSLDETPEVPVTGPLDLKACLDLAFRRNPTLLTARTEVRRYYHAYKLASSIPSTTLSLNRTQGSGPTALNSYSGLTQDTYLQLQQTFWPLGSFTTQRKMALRDFYTARANLKGAEVTLKQQVKDAYFTVLSNQEKLRVARQNLDLAEHIFGIASKRFDAGAGPKLDLLTAEVQRNLANQTLILAEASTAQAKAQLAPFLGLAAHAPFEVTGELVEPARPLVFTALLAMARAHPQVEAARETLAKAQQTVTYNAQQSNPTPGLFSVYDVAQPGYVVGLSLSVPISWGQIGYTTKVSKDLVREQELAVQNATQSVSSNLRSNFDLYLAATRNADLYVNDILRPQEQAANITSIGFTRGALSYTALLQVEQNLVQVRSMYYDVLLSVHTSFDALEAAAGQALDAIPPQPPAPASPPLPSAPKSGAP